MFIPPFAIRLRRMGHPDFCGWDRHTCGAVDGDLRVVEERDLVGEHEFGDGEVVLLRGREEIGGAAEGIRDGAGAGVAFGGAFGFGDNEASANGLEYFFGHRSAGVVEGG